MDTLDDNLPDTTPATPPATPQYALTSVVVPLLRGVLYREEDPALWTTLLAQRARVADYVAVLALDLHVDEAEG